MGTDAVYKKHMRSVALIGFIFGIILCSPVKAQNVSSPGVVRYLGLAVPYPENPPDDSTAMMVRDVRFSAAVRVWLTVDSSGKTLKVAYADDSAAYIDPIKTELESLQFLFTPGRSLPSPLSIPVTVDYSDRTPDGWMVRTLFPVSADLATDSVLLGEFFASNGVEPPRISTMMPIDYSIGMDPENLRYWTVTAQVSLDAGGRLQDITYPVPGQDAMRHPVQMALIRADYTPAQLRGEPFATDFLVTFRIFDNIKYPYSPLDRSDTTGLPVSARYVMTYYYNENDIFLYPIPRRPASETLQSSKLGRLTGFSNVTVDIDTAGNVTGARVRRTVERVRQSAAQAARLIQWYPAIDTRGRPDKYTGNIRFDFAGKPKIVYIPEWMPR